MTVPAQNIGLGTTLTVNDAGTGASSGAQTAFNYLLSVKLPKGAYDYVAASYLTQGDVYRREIPTMITPGDLEFTVDYTNTDVTRMNSLKGVSHTWVITFPDTSTWTQTGYLTDYEPEEITEDQIIKCKVTVKCQGAPTWVGV